MAAPSALVASCSNVDSKTLVKEILRCEELPPAENPLEDIQSYPWHIDTKYYTADVCLCTTANKTIGNAEFASNVQAIILHFDSKEENSFAIVNSWLPFLKEIEPEIQILLCDCCRYEDVVSKSKVQDWCLKNNFELVEIKPDDDSDSEEDDFCEPKGIDRVIKALHAHTWPNLVMKDSRSTPFRSPFMQQMIAAEATGSKKPEMTLDSSSGTHNDDIAQRLQPVLNASESQDSSEEGAKSQGAVGENNIPNDSSKTDAKKPKDKKPESSNKIDSLLSEDMALFNALGNEDPETESFEELFTKMKVMKEKAEALPPEERKTYAEKVAISFWRAIGGDEDEIDGLTDSD